MTLLTAFARLPDPRIARRRRYALGDLLFIALCAVLCGANNFVEIELWAKAKQEWLQERLDLQQGIPSHDTGEIAPQFTRFGRVFARLEAKIFVECFHQWTQSIATRVKGDIIADDGKEVRPQTGLCIDAALDTKAYPTRVVVSEAQLSAVNLERATFHGEWNYTIHPEKREVIS